MMDDLLTPDDIAVGSRARRPVTGCAVQSNRGLGQAERPVVLVVFRRGGETDAADCIAAARTRFPGLWIEPAVWDGLPAVALVTVTPGESSPPQGEHAAPYREVQQFCAGFWYARPRDR